MTVDLLPSNLTELRNHWWWRPGWRTGRRFYACHLTFPGPVGDDLRRLVDQYHKVLRTIPGLTLIPHQWLHLTMQGIGFADEISDKQLDQLVARLRERLSEVRPFNLTVQHPTLGAEAITLHAEPTAPLHGLRTIVQSTAAAVLGGRTPTLAPDFRPHVSVAYVAASQPAQPVHKALASVEPRPATIRITDVPLLSFHRDNRMYEWRTLTRMPLRLLT